MVAIWIGSRKDVFGRGRSWIDDRKIVERGAGALDWLRTDERGRVVSLVVASVALSIALSVLATALVRVVEHRRAVGATDADEPVPEAEAHVETEPAELGVPTPEQAPVPAEA